MELPDESIKKFKKIFEKQIGKEVSWEYAQEGARNLTCFAELLYKQANIEHQRKLRLKESPKGFHLEGNGYTCMICGNYISNEETWYDKWGVKCLICQKAIDKRLIPGSITRNTKSWYSVYDLEDRFNIDKYVMKRFIKAGVLKSRIVPNNNGTPHVYIFLIKDNKDTLPPKKLTESQIVKEVEEDDTGSFHLEPWYKFVNPFEHLKGYKIMDYLQFTSNKKM